MMRNGFEALKFSAEHPTIPVSFVGWDGVARTVTDLMCARSVMADFGIIPVDDMGSANRMWERTVNKHTDGSEPPIGFPGYFPNSRAGSSGHIAEYAGNGTWWTTPVWLEGGNPYYSKHLITTAALERACGNKYAGWGSDFAGMTIPNTSSAATGGVTLIDGEEDMTSIPEYIWTDQDGAGYALIDSNYVDGCIVTGDIKIANNFSYLTARGKGFGGGTKLTRADFNASCAAALALWRAYASRSTADVNEDALATAIIKKLGPSLADDTDLAALKKDILAGLAGVPAAAASAVDSILKDDFATLTARVAASVDDLTTAELDAIAKTVLDAQAARLKA